MEKKLRVKAILLDLDGTVLDSRGAYLAAVKTAFAALGQETFEAASVMEIPKRLEQGLRIDDLVSGLDVDRFLKVYLKAFYEATGVKSRPMPSVACALERLSTRAMLAVTTMRYVPKSVVVAELERFGLARFFRFVVTALDTDRPKPSPEGLVKCAMHFGVDARDCLVVGDSIMDVRAGKNAGVLTAGVLSGIFSREELERENPDLILESVSLLPDFVE